MKEDSSPGEVPEWFSMADFEQFSTDEKRGEEDGDEEGAQRLEVDDEGHNDRLDSWLSRAMNVPRAQAQRLIDDECVHYVGPRRIARLKHSMKVAAGDVFKAQPLEVEPLDVEAEDIPLDVVHEDGDLIVLIKPRGLVVHPAVGHSRGTLVNALLFHCKDLSGIAGVGRPGIVHRLDKDTSGLMVVAKNDAAHSALTRQFAGRQVKKEYLALVHGRPAASAVIDMPIGRHPMDRKRMSVIHSGRPAVTEYERVEEFLDFSLVRVRIRTGRTHQIRVHMSWLGHPVAGDPVYCRRDPLELHGQFLHAQTLGFAHPVSGAPLEFCAPLPDALEQVLKTLRADMRKLGADMGRRGRQDSLHVLDGWREAASGA